MFMIEVIAGGAMVIMFLFVLELVRMGRLTFKYAMGWLLVCIFGFFSVVFNKYIFDLAYWLGFEVPSNFIFFALFCVFVFLGLLLTVFLCQQNKRNDVMAQKIAILELEHKRLLKVINEKSK